MCADSALIGLNTLETIFYWPLGRQGGRTAAAATLCTRIRHAGRRQQRKL
jgi:hypothetical protein